LFVVRDTPAVFERDRPIDERVSVLDRESADIDALPSEFSHREDRIGARIEPGSLRLAAVAGEIRLYVARGIDEESLVELTCHPSGGGASAGPRSTLVTHGARIGSSSGGGLSYVNGIVPDAVIAVRVGGVDAVLGDNGFIAVGKSLADPIVLVTADGERTVERPSFPPVGNPDASSPQRRGYRGLVEYAHSGVSRVAIDDLDEPHWTGALSTFLRSARAPDVWTVGVVLLEGHRAGDLAIADLVVRRDDQGEIVSVQFEGQSAFGPHPDPPRLEAALERLRELRGFGGANDPG
jgi:hypothetical protein